ncbi:MAG: YdcF family protein [Thermoguttaceae bacterium]
MSRRWLVALLLAVVVLAACWAAYPRLLRAAASWLDVGQRPHKADYVMLLNGGENSRPFAAAALVKGHWARRVLVAETAASPEVIDGIVPPYHEINRRVLLSRGVAAADVAILPSAAASTYDEAAALVAFLRDKPNARVLVVTNDCHTRRSRWVFARVLGDRGWRVSFVSAPSDEFPMDRWWQSQVGLLSIVTEYLKLAFYAASYGYLGYWLVACGVLCLTAGWIRRHEASCARDRERVV